MDIQSSKHNQLRYVRRVVVEDKSPAITYSPTLLQDIRTGDMIGSRGDRHIAGISGKVTKVNRVTLDLETEYMGQPMKLRIRRDDLRGEVRLVRDGQIYSDEEPR